MKKINIGVLGAGRIGQVHMAAMSKDPRIHIAHVADPFMTPELAQKLSIWGVSNTSKDENNIFNDGNIDAIFICSPTSTHTPFSLKAIANNKHVFCEKPVDKDIAKILEVKEALQKSSVVYQVGFNRRFDNNFLAAKKAIAEKKIGVPQMLRITSRDPSPPPIEYIKDSGGLFLDMMIHDFDMARFQTQSEIIEVYALGAVLVDKAIGEVGKDIDSAIVTLKFANGMIGFIENCRQAKYGYDQRVEVLGTEGAVHVENVTESTAVISNVEGVKGEKPLHFFLERYALAYEQEQKEFFDAILNKKPTSCGIDEGYESVCLAYAAKKSLEENRPVGIAEIKKQYK